MKTAFSLLELIFSIVIIGIIAAFAIPKYMDTRDAALASTIERDIVSTITSVQRHYLVNRKIENISDAITLNTTTWKVESKKITFKDQDNECISLEVEDKLIKLKIIKDAGSVCETLVELGIESQNFDLI